MHLYGAKLSPFVMRPVLAARAKGHELEPEDFEGGIKSPAYLALSPLGKMPLLVDDDGFALPESQAITDYLDRKLSGPSLSPSEPQAAARCRLIVRIADLYMVPHLGGLLGRNMPEGVAPAKEGMAKALGYIEHYRVAADPFIVGEAFSVADAALIPLFFFFDALDRSIQSAALIAERPGLAAWWDRAKASELGARCVAEQMAGLKAMRS